MEDVLATTPALRRAIRGDEVHLSLVYAEEPHTDRFQFVTITANANECGINRTPMADVSPRIAFMLSSNFYVLLVWELLSLLCMTVLLVGCSADDGSADDGSAAVDQLSSGGNQAGSQTADSPRNQSEGDKLRKALELHRQGKSADAIAIVQLVLIASPENRAALRLAVEILNQQGQVCEAGDLARQAADADPLGATSMLIVAFECHLRCKNFHAAEQDLERAAEINPDLAQVHRLLAQLLNAQGRRLEASKHVRQLIRLRSIQPNELLSLIDQRGPFVLASFDEFSSGVPISLFDLGKVRFDYSTKRANPEVYSKAIDAVIEKFPDSTAAAAFRCRIFADTDQFAKLAESFKTLPFGIEEQSEYWFALGTLLAHQNQDREAIRAFAEALRHDPTDRESRRGMISSLLSIDEPDHALFLRERLADLDLFFRIALEADEEQSVWISTILQTQLRPWEAIAWLMHAARMNGNLAEVMPELSQRHGAITTWEREASSETIAAARLERMLGFKAQQWPMPDRESLPDFSIADSDFDNDSKIELVDVANDVGLTTTFVSGFPFDGSGFSTYQVNGGGLAVLDYDLDGRCDVYVVQSGGDPHAVLGSKANQLYRLLSSERFVEVTDPSLAGDRHFGQGVCAGDLNQDGFPDLLIANIGINTIYMNQGDGTYRQATQRITDNPFMWTSSIGLGDLDGDHLPDIVEVNYIDDPDAYTVKCTDNYMDCQPQGFRKSKDRVLRCLPEGTFDPWQSFLENSPSAKLGFGLVIANFDRSNGNDFFVSNDGDFNHYWVSAETSDPDDPRFDLVESANLYGCNIGRGGNSQACMGVASGDFNRDGTLDLHITNFYNESANLFLQSQSGIFTDQASKLGMVEPSFGVLGFGTQAADFDNDGWLDMAVLNGHVYDGRADDIPFQIPPQLLRGSRNGYRLLDPSSVGTYWQNEQLGRTLATLDWNRDGKMDLLANHLDLPVALLQNNSPAANWLQLELVGVISEREAIGAEVQAKIGTEYWTQSQTGGDGLMCTNEPILHFGIGSAKSVDQIEVQWPSGRSQIFRDLQPNNRYLVIEGMPQPYRR